MFRQAKNKIIFSIGMTDIMLMLLSIIFLVVLIFGGAGA